MKYRVKLAEKLWYTLLMFGAFLCYKSPAVLNWVVVDWAQYSIPGICLSIVAFLTSGWYYEDQCGKSQK